MTREHTAVSIRAMLKKEIVRAGSLRKAALHLRISPAYLSDILSERREPGRKVCAALGLRKETVTRRSARYYETDKAAGRKGV